MSRERESLRIDRTADTYPSSRIRFRCEQVWLAISGGMPCVGGHDLVRESTGGIGHPVDETRTRNLAISSGWMV